MPSTAINPPYDPGDVRPEYAAGTWTYALGKPALEHPDYDKAVRKAERQGWNPWWIRQWNDVIAVLDYDYFMHEDSGRYVVDYFATNFRHTDGKLIGQPFIQADWQQYDLTIPIYGWMRPEGVRRYRSVWIEVPKKMGKSTYIAGNLVMLTAGDGEPRAQVYCIASDFGETDNIYLQAEAFVESSPTLNLEMECVPYSKRIIHAESKSAFRAFTGTIQQGQNMHAVAIDEIHNWKPSGRKIFGAIRYGGASRRQPIMFTITTAGVYAPTSVGYERHAYTMKVLQGIQEDLSYYGYICCAEEGADIEDPVQQMRANPNIGISVSAEELAETAYQSRTSTLDVLDYERYRFNIWTRQASGYIDPADWQRCAAEYTEADLEGRDCYGWLDLSLSKDMTSAGLWFPAREGQDEKPRILPYYWSPMENIGTLDDENNGYYSSWIQDGYLFTTPGRMIDTDFVREFYNELGERFMIHEIAFDPAFSGTITAQLTGDGFVMVLHRQSFYKMNEPTREFERLVMHGEVEHNSHPILDWNIANCEAIANAQGLVMISKGDNLRRMKVDGVVGATMALARAAVNMNEDRSDIYDGEDLLVLG